MMSRTIDHHRGRRRQRPQSFPNFVATPTMDAAGAAFLDSIGINLSAEAVADTILEAADDRSRIHWLIDHQAQAHARGDQQRPGAHPPCFDQAARGLPCSPRQRRTHARAASARRSRYADTRYQQPSPLRAMLSSASGAMPDEAGEPVA